MPAARFIVHGRVQGVGFRWWVRTRAEELRLTGHVRNRTNGTVEVLASGSPDALDSLRTALRSGPSAAHVSDVEEHPAEHQGAGFDIIR
jgi:acylphosphatase